MRPLDDETLAMLDAIDATLAGEPVDPEHADVAELALLLQSERPAPRPEFAGRLDARVARRFASATPGRRASARWLFAPAAGLAVAGVVAVVVVTSGGSSQHSVAGEARRLPSGPVASAAAKAPPTRGSLSQGSPLSPANPAGVSSAAPVPAPTPVIPGRKQVQSAQLSLSASGSRIDDVTQEVFDVVGADHGYVNNSTVTATGGPGAYAQFQLTVPSGALSSAMTQLSELRYARVVSRTDTSNDVTNQFNSTSSQLAQARALRTSLLKQLQNAVTQTQIDAIKARLSDVHASISRDERARRSLNHQVSYSQISLTVGAHLVPVSHKSHGFTLGKAAHDAGHVLEVAAGVALIALAVLVPVSLVAALAWWIAASLRRRRREQALDLA
jgi:hypothetical protein